MSTRSRKTKQTSSVSTSRVSSTAAAETPGGPSTSTSSTTQQASSSMSTPLSQRTQSPGRMRPPSPTLISREQEKFELCHLNDRLAAYIDKVRSLELENSRLTRQVQSQEETVTREVTNIKSLFEGELSDARRLLDETAKEKTRLKLENDKLSTDNKRVHDRNTDLERELKDAKRRMLNAEAQVNDLQARLNDAVNQRKHWENEFNKCRKELDDLKKQYAVLQKQHEDEVVQRVDLQNRIQSLKEELAFKGQVHEQELNETRTRTQVEIEETDGRVHDEYESRLKDALQEMREENDSKIQEAREETEAIFAAKLSHLRDLAGKNDNAAQAARDELRRTRKRLEELSSQVTSLSSQNAGLQGRIAELESRLAREEEEHQTAIDARDAEIQRLRDALEDQLSEYRDLLDVKIQLDNEIQSYRRLLESEETRLNISTAEEATPGRSQRRTPVRGTSGKKRKRTEALSTDFGGSFMQQSSSQSGYSQKASSKGSIDVAETDEAGKYVKLFNNSDQDQALGGWQLKHTVGDQETIFKFHRAANLKAQQYVTVWSSDSDATHSPPSDLVMKGQRWFTGDRMVTEVLNPEGEERASRELNRSMLRTTALYRGGSSSSESGVEGDPNQEKCAIM